MSNDVNDNACKPSYLFVVTASRNSGTTTQCGLNAAGRCSSAVLLRPVPRNRHETERHKNRERDCHGPESCPEKQLKGDDHPPTFRVMIPNLAELDPLVGIDADEAPPDGVQTDPTSWDANNLLGRYHIWRIGSKFPIPGSAVANDYKRLLRAPTAADKQAEVDKLHKEFEHREEIMECVGHCAGLFDIWPLCCWFSREFACIAARCGRGWP